MRSPAAAPDVSVIVPVYLAEDTLEACIGSLLAQTLAPERFEILAVLNGPEDGCRAILTRLRAAHPRHALRVLDSPVASAGAARNLGLDEATGAHLTFVDADDWVSANYLAELLAAADGLRMPVAGLVDVALDGTIDEDTAVMRELRPARRAGLALHQALRVTSISVCKLYPAAWLAGHRFDPGLRSGEDVAFNGILFSGFARQFTECAREPYLNGARYFRRLTENSVSRNTATFDFAVTQRLEVIARLTSGLQADPDDRARLIEGLVDAQTRTIGNYLSEHPEDRLRALRAVADRGLHGLTQLANLDPAWPGHAVVTGAARWYPRRQITLLSGSASSINRLAQQIGFVGRNGVNVRLGFVRGTLSSALAKHVQYRFQMVREGARPSSRPSPSRGEAVRRRLKRARYLALKAGRRAAPLVLPQSLEVRMAAKADAGGRKLLAPTRLIVAVDDDGATLAAAKGREAQGAASFHALVLAIAGYRAATPAQAAAIARSAIALEGLAPDDPQLPPPHVWAMAAWRLQRDRQPEHARTVLRVAARVFPGRADDEGFGMIDLLARLPEFDAVPEEAIRQSRLVAVAADRALDAGDVDKAAFLITVACEVLFAQDVQANAAHPPILAEPERLLGGLDGSRAWSLLVTPNPPADDAAPPPAAPPRVLVLPGVYPKFARVVLDALRGHADLTELPAPDLGREYCNTGVSPATVRLRLAQACGLGVEAPPNVAAAFADADTVVVDWADKGAVLASLLTPPGTRLVVRFHGVDSLSLWPLLMDWGRVTDAVFVSHHLRRAVEQILGERIAHVRTHVVANGVDTDRFAAPSGPEAHRRLAMVGWAQRVKDPLWALEVLAELRAHDPAWRLRLIGKDFEATGRVAEDDYAAAFRARALREDVDGAIEYVGFTDDLPRHAADAGFALSASLRESFHIGAIELVAAGAVPVIRNWPAYRGLGGAAELFPEDWVVDSPGEAARRILAHADRPRWEAASADAREVVRERFRARDLGDSYREIVLG